MMARSNIIDVDLHLHHKTAAAALVSDTADPKDAVWMPLSQIELDGEIGETCTVTLPEWLALEKGLI
jgi:hypothetical protein